MKFIRTENTKFFIDQSTFPGYISGEFWSQEETCTVHVYCSNNKILVDLTKVTLSDEEKLALQLKYGGQWFNHDQAK